MDAKDTLIRALDTSDYILTKALERLTREDLAFTPARDCNPIGWMLWHLTRIEDYMVMDLVARQTQLWIGEGWHRKFGRLADPMDTGLGHTAEQVAAFQLPDEVVALGYFKAVRAATRARLAAFKDADFDTPAKPWMGNGPERPSGNIMGIWVGDVLAHTGQIAYLRGMIKGRGWFG